MGSTLRRCAQATWTSRTAVLAKVCAKFGLVAISIAGIAWAGDVSVGLKNDEAAAVSVPLGRKDGVTAESDFEVVAPDGEVLAIVYPSELYGDRFWSQPLPEGAYARIRVGMPVRPVSLGPDAHAGVRAHGERRRRELQVARQRARREALREEIDKLWQDKLRLMDRRDALAEKVFAAEESLIEAELRMDSAMIGEEDDIDRRLEDLEELYDERDELQSQREVLAEKEPFPKAEIRSLTDRVERLSREIDNERKRIRLSRKRTRTARSTYLSRKSEWEKLIAERNALTAEIRFLTERIQALSERLQ